MGDQSSIPLSLQYDDSSSYSAYKFCKGLEVSKGLLDDTEVRSITVLSVGTYIVKARTGSLDSVSKVVVK